MKKHPDDANLLLSLGKLSAQEQFWGKARDYLEASLKLNQKPETYFELARVVETLGNNDLALEHYREGLQFASQTTR